MSWRAATYGREPYQLLMREVEFNLSALSGLLVRARELVPTGFGSFEDEPPPGERERAALQALLRELLDGVRQGRERFADGLDDWVRGVIEHEGGSIGGGTQGDADAVVGSGHDSSSGAGAGAGSVGPEPAVTCSVCGREAPLTGADSRPPREWATGKAPAINYLGPDQTLHVSFRVLEFFVCPECRVRAGLSLWHQLTPGLSVGEPS